MKGYTSMITTAILVTLCAKLTYSYRLNSQVTVKDVPVCPHEDHGESILYPKPENCSQYYQCANGYLYTNNCPPGLYYCAAREYCDYINHCDYSNCVIDPLSEPKIIPQISTSQEIKSNVDLPVCPPPSGNNEIIYFVNADNCGNYFECDNGVSDSMSCPPGLYFCSEKKVCTWSWDNQCSFTDCKIPSKQANIPQLAQEIVQNHEIQTKVYLPVCPPPSGNNEIIYFVNADNCGNYFECDNGVSDSMSCPPGLYFCSEKKVCAWSWDNQCSFSDCKIPSKQATLPKLAQEIFQNHETESKVDLPVCPPPSGNNEIIYFVNADNCANYFECDNGVSDSMSCPPGLYFCSEKKVCAWSWDNQCSFSDCKIPSKQATLPKLAQEIVQNHEIQTKVDLPVCPPPSGNNEIIYFVNADNCGNYFECDNGVSDSMSCPPGLYFCSEKKVCTWSWDNQCSFSDCKIPSKQTTQKKLTQKIPQDHETESKVDLPVCPPPSGNNEIIYFVNADNCGNYFECDNGVSDSMSCPPGLYFCSEKKVCTWSWDNQCSFSDCKIPSKQANIPKLAQEIVQNHEIQTKVDLPVCPPPSGNNEIIYFVNADNCGNYFECDNGVSDSMSCPPGLYFCSEKKVCAWSWDNQCSFSDCKIPSKQATLPKLAQEIFQNHETESKVDLPVCPPPSGNNEIIYFVNANNCANYFECDNGVSDSMSCPPGLYFCSEKKVCAWSWDNQCSFSDCKIPSKQATLPKLAQEIVQNHETESKVDLPVCPPPSGNNEIIYFVNADNCGNYFECDNGVSVSMSCPPGLYFCSEKKVCAWSWDNQCSFSDCKIPASRST